MHPAYTRMAAAIKEQLDPLRLELDGEVIDGMFNNGEAVDAIEAVARTMADHYANTQGDAERARQEFMTACGFTGESSVVTPSDRIASAMRYMEQVSEPNRVTLSHIRWHLTGTYDNAIKKGLM